jgi:hypothetical protein
MGAKAVYGLLRAIKREEEKNNNMASILREDFPLFCSAPSTFYLQILVNITL